MTALFANYWLIYVAVPMPRLTSPHAADAFAEISSLSLSFFAGPTFGLLVGRHDASTTHLAIVDLA